MRYSGKVDKESCMALHVGTMCPSLQGATEWIGEVADVRKLIGHPLIIVFWSASCPACLERFSSIQNWQSEYAPLGLKIITVHSPRITSDFDVTGVRLFLQSKNVSIPCAIDNDQAIAKEFQTEKISPYYFLFGKDGKMKSRAASDVGLKLLKNSLKREIKFEAAQSRDDESEASTGRL
jgi:thiol-disulfide isomerase/thioredoxin